MSHHPKKYGFWSFIWDCIMVFLTCGFWLIWIFVREMRNRREATSSHYDRYVYEEYR